MVRDPGWLFMEAGRRLERALGLVDLLRSTVTTERSTATDSLVFESVLIAAESIITYRRRYRSHAQLETLLDLLVLDAGNPRGLTHQMQLLSEAVSGLPDGAAAAMPATGRMSPAERHVLETLSAVRLADTTALATAGPDGRRGDLFGLLERVEAGLQAIGAAISTAHFTPLQPQRSFMGGADPAGPAELDAVFV
jgi:uncharacterized alpha-E superfamily protein